MHLSPAAAAVQTTTSADLRASVSACSSVSSRTFFSFLSAFLSVRMYSLVRGSCRCAISREIRASIARTLRLISAAVW